MVFSEVNIGVYNKLLTFASVLISGFIFIMYEPESKYGVMCQNQQGTDSYQRYIFYPTVISILICLGVNLKYGKEKYLKTFRKNSHKFKLLFRLHFYYMLFWAV